MKNKLVFAAGMAAGYVLGTRAGRESYEKIKTKATEVWNNPKVQEKVSSTTESVKTKAPAMQEKLNGALNRDKSKETPGSKSGGGSGSGKPTGPSGGSPEQVDITPFLNQDDETRPTL